jgi:hypothetical protein
MSSTEDYVRLKTFRKEIVTYIALLEEGVTKVRASPEFLAADPVLPALIDALEAQAHIVRRDAKERESEVQAQGAMTEESTNKLKIDYFRLFRLAEAVKREKEAWEVDRAAFAAKTRT